MASTVEILSNTLTILQQLPDPMEFEDYMLNFANLKIPVSSDAYHLIQVSTVHLWNVLCLTNMACSKANHY